MKIADWLKACANTSGWSEAKLNIPEIILDGEVYKYDPYRELVMLYPNFTNTDCVREVYDYIDGCQFKNHNCVDNSWIK